jgi:LemA protein
VVNARAKATSIQLSGDDLTDPAKVSAFNQAQNGLSLSLQRLQEAYPQLQSQGNFKTLMDQIEGSENRIAISIRDYNTAVQAYNTRIRTFPDAVGAKIFYGAKPMTPFQAKAGADVAPTVNFGNSN